MTATLENVAKKKDKRSHRVSSRRPRSWSAGPGAGPVPDRPGRPARAADQGGPGNGRDQDLTEHLGHENNAPAGNEHGNNRNGTRPKAGADREHGDVRLVVRAAGTATSSRGSSSGARRAWTRSCCPICRLGRR